jgi:hypothetical protein
MKPKSSSKMGSCKGWFNSGIPGLSSISPSPTKDSATWPARLKSEAVWSPTTYCEARKLSISADGGRTSSCARCLIGQDSDETGSSDDVDELRELAGSLGKYSCVSNGTPQ